MKNNYIKVSWLLETSKAVTTAGSSQGVQQKSFACRHDHLLVDTLSMYANFVQHSQHPTQVVSLTRQQSLLQLGWPTTLLIYVFTR